MRILAALSTGLLVWAVARHVRGDVPRADRSRARREAAEVRAAWLAQAGSDLRPAQFVAGSVGLGALTFGVLSVLTATPAAAVVPSVAVGFAPRAHLATVRSRRIRDLQRAWPDALRDIVAATSAGRSLTQAIHQLATDGPEPLRPPFQRFASLSRVLGVVPALELVREELADPTSDRVIEILVLAHERGGRLVGDILRDLAAATTEDLRTLDEIRTAGLEQRINARAVFVLPWLVLLALTIRDGMFRAFYATPSGLAVIVIAGVLSGVGALLVAHLGRQPDEPRVLGGAGPSGGSR